ncbi:NAD(P)/FAD-dependent oxidoreductase [Paenibacillus sp. J5C_2022]|uniref:NAD(P)/FAD-dependent oxidoreductase n=1 Tax=Paenibacillus sp. J5C2022 TaxID=2977129 RepID=UPI0021D2F849|nr:NAD(P)/FAD-dependent oxidoreductase [Paenibacillus sp. J5C2022]MCU6712086.1 NAD(P)/FAD-dependent oxidoreductase [Paenibacillus sp. J5C2022]
MSKRIVILGGGYGGLICARTVRTHLSSQQAAITIVNRHPEHQIVTELHRLAAGNVSQHAVSLPLDRLLKRKNIDVKIGDVSSIDIQGGKVRMDSGDSCEYDVLVLALGSETNYFGIPGLKENSFSLKSVADANRIHAHLEQQILQFKMMGDSSDATFVVGGGGLSGVELIGEFADELPGICRRHGVSFEVVGLYLIEAMPTILPMFPPHLVQRAISSLEARGVKFLLGCPVTGMRDKAVTLKDGSAIKTGTFVWTGGVKGNPLVAGCGIEVERGRAKVNPYLQSVSHPSVFLAGDCAVVKDYNGRPYPPSAQLALQMGRRVGENVAAAVQGKRMKTFHPQLGGTLASLGRKDGIGTIGKRGITLKGTTASVMKKASNVRYLSSINGLFSLLP